MSSFVLRINPFQTAQKFNFKCQSQTQIDSYTRPPSFGKIVSSLLIPKNGSFYQCMWCSQATPDPIGLPIARIIDYHQVEQVSSNSGESFVIKEEDDFRLRFKTYGIFCCLACCKAFWQDNKHRSQFEMCGLFLQQIWIEENGETVEFKASPPRELLKIFGGPMSYSDFHAHREKPFVRVSLVYNNATAFSCD